MTIRFADVNDVPFIKSCIHELAEYERAPEADCSTEELIRENVFEKGLAKVLIAEIDGEKAGFALWFNNFSTWLARPGIYLEDLYVRPAFRKRGAGKALLMRLAELAAENNWGRIDWVCLKWNKPGLDFYESLGAKQMSDWAFLRLDGGNLLELSKKK